MSDDWITVIPEDPRFVPDESRQKRAEALLARIAPDAEEIEVNLTDHVLFFDCGENFERVSCPSCRREIAMEWWQERMEDDGNEDEGFKLSKYPTPCCRSMLTLHELVYDWPQGFGRFAIDVMNPGIGELSEGQRQELQEILGVPLRIIYQHL
jgi:hypothetical protein